MKRTLLFVGIFFIQLFAEAQKKTIIDTSFLQEYHEYYAVSNVANENNIRSIAVDKSNAVWIATSNGVFKKDSDKKIWNPILLGDQKGSAYKVLTDNFGQVWIGTWKGVYLYKDNKLSFIPGTSGPISALCLSTEGLYAAGPNGTWLFNGHLFINKNYTPVKSIRNIISDNNGGLWTSTDVGLYHFNDEHTVHHYQKELLLSAYIKDVAIDEDEKTWVAGLGGITILSGNKKERVLTTENGCPSVYINCLKKASDGTMWVGSDVGIVRFKRDGSHSLLFSKRWLSDDRVNEIAFDTEGNAWIATPQGVNAIKRNNITLADKQNYFYGIQMSRHMREPWISGQCHLKTPGDVSSWEPEDDDNDGEFTGNYLMMESFRYAVTKSADAKKKAQKAFDFLQLLQKVTGTDGFFARTIVPASWGNKVHDGNMLYSETDKADELVKEPRYKPVEIRWRKSADGKWLWKGDTSSDEMCGHMIAYYFYYELVADDEEKERIRNHITTIVDYLIKHNYNFVDIDGMHTRWSVWSPDQLNHDPEWMPDRSQNSMELLGILKLAYYVSGKAEYEQRYQHLIKEEHYLQNMEGVLEQNPAWFVYFDVSLQSYIYPILLRCETDPALLSFYRQHIDAWMHLHKKDKSPMLDFFYAFARNKKIDANAAIDFLKDTPLDLINWHIDHTKRADVQVVHEPVLEQEQINQLPPPSIRATVRWDANPWLAVNGYPDTEREPVFWLLPYWMGRYLQFID